VLSDEGQQLARMFTAALTHAVSSLREEQAAALTHAVSSLREEQAAALAEWTVASVHAPGSGPDPESSNGSSIQAKGDGDDELANRATDPTGGSSTILTVHSEHWNSVEAKIAMVEDGAGLMVDRLVAMETLMGSIQQKVADNNKQQQTALAQHTIEREQMQHQVHAPLCSCSSP
jgi:hypothetical protein